MNFQQTSKKKEPFEIMVETITLYHELCGGKEQK